MTDELLPPEFGDLTPLVAEWCLATEDLRLRKRVSSDRETIEVFHDAAFPRLPAMLDYLNRTGLNDPDKLTPPVRRLYDLALMIMEASQPIDLEWSGSDIGDAFPIERFGLLPPSAPG